MVIDFSWGFVACSWKRYHESYTIIVLGRICNIFSAFLSRHFALTSRQCRSRKFHALIRINIRCCHSEFVGDFFQSEQNYNPIDSVFIRYLQLHSIRSWRCEHKEVAGCLSLTENVWPAIICYPKWRTSFPYRVLIRQSAMVRIDTIRRRTIYICQNVVGFACKMACLFGRSEMYI